jgi:CRP-like cAMP-binding protein
MSDSEKLAWQSNEFFRGLKAEQLERVEEIGKIVEFGPRVTLFEEYDWAKDVYFILDGEVSLAICTPKQACRQIGIVRSGELLGWSTVVGRSRLFDTARTLTPVKAFVVDGARLMEFCQQSPDFGFEFMRRVASVLADRLSATRTEMVEISGEALPVVPLESD